MPKDKVFLHDWNEDGSTCLVCGHKDWMPHDVCKRPSIDYLAAKAERLGYNTNQFTAMVVYATYTEAEFYAWVDTRATLALQEGRTSRLLDATIVVDSNVSGKEGDKYDS